MKAKIIGTIFLGLIAYFGRSIALYLDNPDITLVWFIGAMTGLCMEFVWSIINIFEGKKK